MNYAEKIYREISLLTATGSAAKRLSRVDGKLADRLMDSREVRIENLYRLVSEERRRRQDGGAGSGNWGHAGRKGKRGGSESGGGKHNRVGDPESGFTSFAKDKKKYATLHATSKEEFEKIPTGSVISHPKISAHIVKQDDGFINMQTGELLSLDEMSTRVKEASIAIPDSEKSKYVSGYLKKFSVSDSRVANTPEITREEDYDAKMREQAGEVWRGCSFKEKKALKDYTGADYIDINDYLRTKSSSADYTREEIKDLTNAISKSKIKDDIWLYRGVGQSSAAKFLNMTEEDLANIDPKKLIGKVWKDEGFMSCGSVPGTGFGKAVSFKIFVPAGAQALYVEPFSSSGDGAGPAWDGWSKQSSFSGEFETLLQRGTCAQVIDAGYNNGKLEIVLKVTEQNYSINI